MSDSPVSDQAPEDLRSDTTKKKSAGTDGTHRHWLGLGWTLENISRVTGTHLVTCVPRMNYCYNADNFANEVHKNVIAVRGVGL